MSIDIPNTEEQRKGDYFMLGIRPANRRGMYHVGPSILYGPAMETARHDPKMRLNLVIANPKVPRSIKQIFVGKQDE